jgi:hypothetical protein
MEGVGTGRQPHPGLLSAVQHPEGLVDTVWHKQEAGTQGLITPNLHVCVDACSLHTANLLALATLTQTLWL